MQDDPDKVLQSDAADAAESLLPQVVELGLDGIDQARVNRYVLKANADATLLAYRSSWALFVSWCADNDYAALPASPMTVAAYLTDLAENGSEATGHKALAKSTLKKKLSAIVFAHRVADQLPPTHQPGAHELDRVMAGIRRDRAAQPKARKRAAPADILEAMLEAIPGGDLRAVRDRAVLAIGMAGALRRSELVAIQREHVTLDRRGIVLEIPVSKTDQEGKGHTIAIPRSAGIDAVGHLERWLDVTQIMSGPVFLKLTPQGRLGRTAMSAQGVALIVKAAVAGAGLDPAGFAAHSLRSGFLTEAARRGADPFAMQRQSRHKSLDIVSEYVRAEDLFDGHAGATFV
jgi:integrase